MKRALYLGLFAGIVGITLLCYDYSTKPEYRVGDCFTTGVVGVSKVIAIERYRYIYIDKLFPDDKDWMKTPNSANIEITDRNAIRVNCETGEYLP